MSDRKKNPDIYRHSRYYARQRQLRLRLAAAVGGFCILLLVLAVLNGTHSRRSTRSVQDSQQVSSRTEAGSQEQASSSSGPEDSSAPAAQNPEEGVEKEDAPSPAPEKVTLKLSVIGDCTLGTDEYFDWDSSLNNYFDMYGPEYFFRNVRDIFSEDDLTIGNFEGTLTYSEEREDKQFAFKGDPAMVSILTEGKVEAVNTANNHSHDYGYQSYEDTLKALDNAGLVNFGYDKTAVMDVKGVKVGLVGIYELDDHLMREQQLRDNIQKVKDAGSQLIVVIFHWGNELEEVPDTNQLTLGRLAVDLGAHLVCGHHPHVVQGIETYKGKNIVYSLGNFCFGGNTLPTDMDTMIYQQTFTITPEGVQEDPAYNVIPCSVSSEDWINNYQPTPASGEDADRIMQKIQERSSWIPEPAVTVDTNSLPGMAL